jgi:hypothetical protein
MISIHVTLGVNVVYKANKFVNPVKNLAPTSETLSRRVREVKFVKVEIWESCVSSGSAGSESAWRKVNLEISSRWLLIFRQLDKSKVRRCGEVLDKISCKEVGLT